MLAPNMSVPAIEEHQSVTAETGAQSFPQFPFNTGATGEWMTQQDGFAVSEQGNPGDPPRPASILYSVNIQDSMSGYIRTAQSDRQFPLETQGKHAVGKDEDEERTVFQVFTDVVTTGNMEDVNAFYQFETGGDIGRIKVKQVLNSRIDIYSQMLLDAIRSVVSYYPGYATSSSSRLIA